MSALRAIFHAFSLMMTDRRAATAVEYGFIAAIIVVGMIAALQGLADTTVGIWTNTATKVQNPGK